MVDPELNGRSRGLIQALRRFEAQEPRPLFVRLFILNCAAVGMLLVVGGLREMSTPTSIAHEDMTSVVRTTSPLAPVLDWGGPVRLVVLGGALLLSAGAMLLKLRPVRMWVIGLLGFAALANLAELGLLIVLNRHWTTAVGRSVGIAPKEVMGFDGFIFLSLAQLGYVLACCIVVATAPAMRDAFGPLRGGHR